MGALIGHGETGDPAEKPEHDRLHEQLAHEAKRRSAQRGAHRHLALTAEAAGQDEARHVRTGDHEHETHDPQQGQERRSHVAGHLFLQRDQPVSPILVVVGKGRGQPVADPVELGPRLGQGHRRLEPRDDVEIAQAALGHQIGHGQGRGGHREVRQDPGLRFGRPGKALGHDSDHGHRHRAEADGAPDHRRVGPEHALPGTVAQNGQAITRMVAVRSYRAAEGGRSAEHVEKAVRHLRSDQPLRLPRASGQVENQPAVAREALERAAVLVDVQEVRGRMGVFRRGRQRPPHHRDALRVVVGERPEEDGVDHAEERGVGSDAEGQGPDRYHGERAVLGEGPQAVSHVLHKAHGVLRLPLEQEAGHWAPGAASRWEGTSFEGLPARLAGNPLSGRGTAVSKGETEEPPRPMSKCLNRWVFR